jgi:hypothetical protein
VSRILLFLNLLFSASLHWFRKYIPIGTSTVLPHCSRGFINVMATSSNDPDAVVCCEALPVVDPTTNATVISDATGNDLSSTASLIASWMRVPYLHESSSAVMDLCPNRSFEYQTLPLAARLSRFPDAWLIPLSPLLLRFACLAAAYLNGSLRHYLRRLGRSLRGNGLRQSKRHREHLPPQPQPPPDLYQQFVPLLLRLGLYVLIFNFRGWVLYVAFNQVEDSIVSVPHRNTCSWYLAYLRDDQRHECVGRIFDYSDHMALYYAQLLPIPLLETLYALMNPYWCRSSSSSPLSSTDKKPSDAHPPSVAVPHHYHHPSPRFAANEDAEYDSPVEQQDPAGNGTPSVASPSSSSRAGVVDRTISWFAYRTIPVLLATGLAYLYLITYLGVYKTAYYFHTIDEVVLGYVVSLAVQVPMAMLLLWNNNDGDGNNDVRRYRLGSPRLPRNSADSKAPFDAPSSRPSPRGFHRILARTRALLFPSVE